MAEEIVIKDKRLEELEREITCGICQEHYTEPKILPCQHYYCKQCVLRVSTKTATSQPFSCPECRTEATLPEGGVGDLKTAFHINRLKDIVSMMKRALSKEKPHDRLCLKHKEQPLILYCFNCESLICLHCTVKDHVDHKFDFCEVTASTTKEEILEKLKTLKNKKESIAQAIVSIQTNKQEIEAQEQVVATNIQEEFKILRKILDDREQELLQEAVRTNRKKLDKLSAQEKNLSAAGEVIQSVVDYSEQFVSHCSDNEVMGMHIDISKQIEQKVEEHSELSLEPEEEADIGVEVKCEEALQQLCQTQANIIQLTVDPNKCTVTMEDESNFKVGKLSTAVLVTRLPNNTITKRHHEVSCSLKSLYNNVSTQCKVDPTGAGQYSIQYTPTVRGRHELTVSVDGQQVAGSPFPVFVSIHPSELGKPVKLWKNHGYPSGITVNSLGEIFACARDGSIIKLKRDGYKALVNNSGWISGSRWILVGGDITLHKLEVDDTNNIYCTSNHSNEIFRCDQNGGNHQVKVVTQVEGGCWGLAVVGEDVMICGKNNGGIVNVYDKELNYKRSIKPKNMGDIYDISKDRHGNLYCADYNNSCIQVFGNDGVFLRSFGCNEKGEKKVMQPCGLYVTSDYVYICNHSSHNISVFTTDGVYVTSFGQQGSGEGDFSRPHSVCVDQDGFVYVTEYAVSCNRIQCF